VLQVNPRIVQPAANHSARSQRKAVEHSGSQALPGEYIEVMHNAVIGRLVGQGGISVDY
jgi:hypothetical protein